MVRAPAPGPLRSLLRASSAKSASRQGLREGRWTKVPLSTSWLSSISPQSFAAWHVGGLSSYFSALCLLLTSRLEPLPPGGRPFRPGDCSFRASASHLSVVRVPSFHSCLRLHVSPELSGFQGQPQKRRGGRGFTEPLVSGHCGVRSSLQSGVCCG